MNIEIANRLVELRKKNNLSQEELADKLGLSRQAVSKWERAEASPDTDNLICLAKIYGVSLDDLLKTDASEEEIAEDVKEQQTAQTRNDDAKEETETINPEVVAFSHRHHHHERYHYNGRWQPIYAALSAMTVFAITIAYLLLGFLIPGAWGIYWTLFLFIPIIESMLDAIRHHNANRFAYPVLVTFIFLFMGLQWGLWNPYWVIFITIPVYYTLANAIYAVAHH